MEYQTRRWQILLTDIMMLTSIPASKGLVLEPGREVALKIEKVDAFNDQLRVGLA
jgi:exoribonuclease-2